MRKIIAHGDSSLSFSVRPGGFQQPNLCSNRTRPRLSCQKVAIKVIEQVFCVALRLPSHSCQPFWQWSPGLPINPTPDHSLPSQSAAAHYQVSKVGKLTQIRADFGNPSQTSRRVASFRESTSWSQKKNCHCLWSGFEPFLRWWRQSSTLIFWKNIKGVGDLTKGCWTWKGSRYTGDDWGLL